MDSLQLDDIIHTWRLQMVKLRKWSAVQFSESKESEFAECISTCKALNWVSILVRVYVHMYVLVMSNFKGQLP